MIIFIISYSFVLWAFTWFTPACSSVFLILKINLEFFSRNTSSYVILFIAYPVCLHLVRLVTLSSISLNS